MAIELFNIYCNILSITNGVLPYEVVQTYLITDSVYSIYVLTLVFSQHEERLKCGIFLVAMSVLSALTWGTNSKMLIVDSIVCIVVIIYYNQIVINRLDKEDVKF